MQLAQLDRLTFFRHLFVCCTFVFVPSCLVPSSLGQGVATTQPSEKESPSSPKIATVTLTNADGNELTVSNRMASWQLGKTLAVAVIMKARGGDEEEYQSGLKNASLIASALKVELPKPPQLQSLSDIWSGREFIAGKEDSVSARLNSKQSSDCSALCRLSADIFFSGLLYDPSEQPNAPDDLQAGINRMLVQNLKINFVNSEFANANNPLQAILPLIELIENNKQSDSKVNLAALNALQGLLAEEFEAAAASASESPTAPLAANPLDAEAKKVAQRFLSEREKARELTLDLKPTREACNKLLKEDVADEVFKFYDEQYGSSEMVIAPSHEHQDVILLGVPSDDLIAGTKAARQFPGGYQAVGPHLQSGHRIYQFSFVRPGEELGLRFDGLVKIDGHWYLFPKLWRAVK
ncbi:MAG: hypothetical protein KDB03_11660 [Planctomycetales bacterium]|nr:hypothetical protein [Planctomycetales bacterium]